MATAIMIPRAIEKPAKRNFGVRNLWSTYCFFFRKNHRKTNKGTVKRVVSIIGFIPSLNAAIIGTFIIDT